VRGEGAAKAVRRGPPGWRVEGRRPVVRGEESQASEGLTRSRAEAGRWQERGAGAWRGAGGARGWPAPWGGAEDDGHDVAGAAAAWAGEDVVRKVRSRSSAQGMGRRERREGKGEERLDEEAQHLGEEPGVSAKAEAHRHGQRQRPLAVGRPGKDALGEVNGGVVCPASVARGTRPARLAGEGNKDLGPVAGAAQAGKAVGPHPAREVTGEVAPDEARQSAASARKLDR
jgi:hypothetical protein